MMGFIARVLILLLGYAFPAYDCYKTVELSKPEMEKLLFWCKYWILMAILTAFERLADNFVSWLPMYGEAKLAFIVYLWYPKTMGTTYVYDSFCRPFIARREPQIDRNLMKLKLRANDTAVLYFQKAANYGQARFHEVLSYVASQSQAPAAVKRQVQQQPQVVRRMRAARVAPTDPRGSDTDLQAALRTADPSSVEQGTPATSISTSEQPVRPPTADLSSGGQRTQPAPPLQNFQSASPPSNGEEASTTADDFVFVGRVSDIMPNSTAGLSLLESISASKAWLMRWMGGSRTR